MTAKISYHPAFGRPPVVNIKRWGDSRKLKVIQLSKARRFELRMRREQREREATERELQAEEDANRARFAEEARKRIPPERRAELCDLARELAGLIFRLDAEDMRTLIEQANYYLGRKAKPPAS